MSPPPCLCSLSVPKAVKCGICGVLDAEVCFDSFLYCDDVRLCCAHEMLEFFHGDPYAVCVELKNFNLCFILEVFCLFRVWQCTGVGM